MAKKSDTNFWDVAKIWVIGGLVISGVATLGVLAVSIFAASRASDFENDFGNENGRDVIDLPPLE